MRRAGSKEREYEGEEESNENLAERRADEAEDLHDDADDAVQQIYERAGENLHKMQRANRKEQQAVSLERHQAIEEAVASLQRQQAAQSFSVASALNLYATTKSGPLVGFCFGFGLSFLLIFSYARKTRRAPVATHLL